MELAFATKQLRTLCENEATADVTLGQIVAIALRNRLADLRAATSIDDLLVGNPRVLGGQDNSMISIDLPDGYQMIFCANHPNNPMRNGNVVDWSKVNRIKILHIGNAHVQ